MKKLTTAVFMKEMEHYTINEIGVPSLSLMETASRNLFLYIKEKISHDDLIYIFAGVGNNGADGLCVARYLYNDGLDFKLFIIGDERKSSPEWKIQQNILKNLGVEFSKISEAYNRFLKPSVIVDSIFGIGLNRVIEGEALEAVNFINDSKDIYSSKIYSMDIPSGLNGSTGEVMGSAVKADFTITNQWNKTGLILKEGPYYSGKVIVKDTGILCSKDAEFPAITYEDGDVCLIPSRRFDAHKSTKGKMLLVGGCMGMPGSVIMASNAAFRSGIGMIKTITHSSNKDLLIHELPEIMIDSYDDSVFNYDKFINDFNWCNLCVIGPGLGTGEFETKMFKEIYTHYEKLLIVDADGLNILANNPQLLEIRKNKGYKTIITPHPLEFARLFNTDVKDKVNQDINVVKKLASENGMIICAKDARTVISDGKNIYINNDTSSVLGTAGSGDVLSGIISAMSVSFNMDLFQAVCMAVHIHSMAGKEAEYEYGTRTVKASDIINGIIHVLG